MAWKGDWKIKQCLISACCPAVAKLGKDDKSQQYLLVETHRRWKGGGRLTFRFI